MERKKKFSDHLDQRIADSLHEQMGPPPSHDVWLRISDEINHSAHPTSRQEPPVHKGPEWLFLFLKRPILQSAFAIMLLLMIMGNSIFLLQKKNLPEVSASRLNLEDNRSERSSPSLLSRSRPLPQSDWHVINQPAPDVQYSKQRRLIQGKRIIIPLDTSASLGNLALITANATPK